MGSFNKNPGQPMSDEELRRKSSRDLAFNAKKFIRTDFGGEDALLVLRDRFYAYLRESGSSAAFTSEQINVVVGFALQQAKAQVEGIRKRCDRTLNELAARGVYVNIDERLSTLEKALGVRGADLANAVRALGESLDHVPNLWNDWERRFIEGITDWDAETLSMKQVAKIYDLEKRLSERLRDQESMFDEDSSGYPF